MQRQRRGGNVDERSYCKLFSQVSIKSEMISHLISCLYYLDNKTEVLMIIYIYNLSSIQHSSENKLESLAIVNTNNTKITHNSVVSMFFAVPSIVLQYAEANLVMICSKS